MKKRTSIKDQENKIDLIEHVNDNHGDELREIVLANSDFTNFLSVKIKDIFEEGVLLLVDIDVTKKEELFVPFGIQGDLEEKVLYLAYKSMSDNGKQIMQTKKQYFVVVKREFFTKNMLRLTVKSGTKISDEAAFAYLFSLKKLKKIGAASKSPKEANFFTRIFEKVFLFVMKILSSKQRKNLMRNMNKNIRYYTVRKTWQEGKEYFAYIDIYIHGKTRGGNWAKSLEKDDIIISTNDFNEHTDHLNNGNALLIGDETSLPAIASILEQWKNPIEPSVIILINAAEEKKYLRDLINKNCEPHYILNSAKGIEDLISSIENVEMYNAVWAGVEKTMAKELGKFIRKIRSMPSRNARIIGYWQKQD